MILKASKQSEIVDRASSLRTASVQETQFNRVCIIYRQWNYAYAYW